MRQALHEQQCFAHADGVTDAIMAVHELVSFKPSEHIVTEGNHDNDIYFILAGTVSVQVKGREVAVRGAGLHVGEMAMIEPAEKRCATVVCLDEVVAAKVAEPKFAEIAEKYPYLWRRLAMELGARLRERGKHVRAPNQRPHIFLGSSVEGITVAKEIQLGLTHLNGVVHLWTNNVFIPGHGTMEDLEAMVNACDVGVVVCTPDDKVINVDRQVDMHAPRDNCILELGMSIGALGRKRTLLVRPRGRDLKIPTDLLGITPIEYVGDDPEHLSAHISHVCTLIEKVVKSEGPR